MTSGWLPKQLTAAQREERRMRAAALLRAGRHSQATIARHLGVSRQSVSRWAETLAREGRAGLRRQPRRGRPSRLSPAQWRRLAAVLRRGALAAGFPTERWTLPRLALVAERVCGVRYHPRSMGRVLRAHGWTPQRPVRQARERDDALVEAWLKRDWPRIKRGLVEAGGSLPSWTKRVTRFGPP